MKKYSSLILAILLIVPVFVSADTEQERIKQLQAQIEQLQQQEAQYKNTIAQTQEEADTLKAQIQGLQGQIVHLQAQLQLTGKQIDQTTLQISDAQQKITYEKSAIAQLVLYLAKRDAETLTGILLKSANLSDYFNQEQYALTANSKLLASIQDLRSNENQLTTQKKSLVNLQNQQAGQKAALAMAQSGKNQLLAETKGQEAQYQRLLADTLTQEQLFFSQIQELETHVIQGGLYIVHVTASNLPKKAKIFEWPEDKSHVTQGYGCTKFARCKHKSGPYNGAPHNGVDMAEGFGTAIHAIGAGIIVANGHNDGWGNWVAIQHPDQYNLVSVYAHMSALSFLQVGTAVTAGEVIGYEGNTGNAEGSHLHLSLYKDFFTYVSTKEGSLYFNYFEGSVNPLDYLK